MEAPNKDTAVARLLDALKETAAKYLPAGYGYEFSGMSSEEIKAGNKTVMIFAISIVFVFLFLAALYESWSVPFSVLFAVPIGALGSIIALTFLPSLTDNIYAQIGLITLIGLAAKNAILIVEFAKERVDSGMELLKATIAAVKLAFTPDSYDIVCIYSWEYCHWRLPPAPPLNHAKPLAGLCLVECWLLLLLLFL